MATTAKPKAPVRIVGVAGVGAWLGVDGGTVTKWYLRDLPGLPGWDFESPSRNAQSTSIERYWLDTPENKAKFEAWQAARPGQGRPGQPKPRKAKEDAAA